MNLWPFSKKNNASADDSHFELPPGVVLATTSETAFPQDIPEELANSTPELNQFSADTSYELPEPVLNIQAEEPVLSLPDPSIIPPPQAEIQPAQPYPNSHLLDLITPPATPDIRWHSVPTPSQTTTAEESSLLSANLPQFDPVEESFALAEADNTFEHFDTSSLLAAEAEPLETGFGFDVPETFDLGQADEWQPDLTQSNVVELDGTAFGTSSPSNVVPFPVRPTFSSEESLSSPEKEVFTDTTSFEDEIVFDLSEAEPLVQLDTANQTDTWNEISFELTDAERFEPENIYLATPSEDSTNGSFVELGPEKPVSARSAHPEELWANEKDIEALQHGYIEEHNELETLALQPEDILLEPAITELDAYDSILDPLPIESETSGSEEEHLCWNSKYGEEEPASSSVKEWATYDLGHYEDPDEAAEPLVLDEELLSPSAIIEDAVLHASTTAEAKVTEADIPSAPLQGEVVSSTWVKPSPKPSASKALNNFSQQVLLEESQAIKRSIDDLVSRYFSQKA